MKDDVAIAWIVRPDGLTFKRVPSENHALIRLTRALCPRRVRQFGRARTIDWILIRGPLASVGAELQDSVLASDHYPVSLTVVPKLGSTSLFRA